MKRTKGDKRIGVTMTYDEWVCIIRACNIATREFKDYDKMLPSEKVLMEGHIINAKRLLMQLLTDKLA